MKLERIPVPLWSPPRQGPWTLRWTRPDRSTFRGDDYKSTLIWDLYSDADYWRGLAERANPEGCRVDVVPALQGDRK